ncbi:MAG: hypothetical protein ACOZAM_05625 [Pseudomonadota bacterium]
MQERVSDGAGEEQYADDDAGPHARLDDADIQRGSARKCEFNGNEQRHRDQHARHRDEFLGRDIGFAQQGFRGAFRGFRHGGKVTDARVTGMESCNL